jgi:hypothetical protein
VSTDLLEETSSDSAVQACPALWRAVDADTRVQSGDVWSARVSSKWLQRAAALDPLVHASSRRVQGAFLAGLDQELLGHVAFQLVYNLGDSC